MVRVVIERGVPGVADRFPRTGPVGYYPVEAQVVAKLLAAEGADVEFADPRQDREDVGLNSFEVWQPVLTFVASVAANLASEMLARVFDHFVAPLLAAGDDAAAEPVLHAEVTVNGRTVRLDGPASQVREALRELPGADR